MLAVIETHPIQYHAPVYRALQARYGIPVTAIYGSDFSVQGYRDQEFGATFAWDTDLLSGYRPLFLSRVAEGGARAFEQVSPRGLARALRQVAPTATLVCGYSPRFHQVALFEAWRARRPILFRAETTDHAQVRGDLKSWVRDRALRAIYARCARLLYVGQHSLHHFKRLACPDDKLVFSPYCVDTSPFAGDEAARARLREVTRAQLDIAPDRRVLLFSGKLSARKGPDVLLEAVKRLPAEERQSSLVLFLGSGDMQEALREQARRAPAVEVVFAGFQNQTRLSAYYHAADMLVLPSQHSETWGLVVNEALFHGLPCVVSDGVGCGPDLIVPGATGEIFRSDSAAELASAVTRVAALIGRAEVRDQCRAAVARYSVERAAAGIADAYAAVARRAA